MSESLRRRKSGGMRQNVFQDDLVRRQMFLPVGPYENAQGQRYWAPTFPQAALDVMDAVTLPSRVYRGEVHPDDMIGEVMNFTGSVSAGALGAAVPSGATLGANALRRETIPQQPRGGMDSTVPAIIDDKLANSGDLPLGQAPDRSGGSFRRYRPKAGTSRRMEVALEKLRNPNNPVRIMMDNYIANGSQFRNWYNTEWLRGEFVKRLGEQEGDRAWREWAMFMGAASPGSNVEANIRNSSMMRHRLGEGGIHPPMMGHNGGPPMPGNDYRDRLMQVQSLADAQAIGRERKELFPGTGHVTQGLQEYIMARILQGRWDKGLDDKRALTENPKPKGFANSFLGDPNNIAADLHWTRFLALAARDKEFFENGVPLKKDSMEKVLRLGPRKLKPYLREGVVDGKPVTFFDARKALNDKKVTVDQLIDEVGDPTMFSSLPRDNEYAYMEDLAREIGKEYDMTPSQVQASLWMGAADLTGLHPNSRGSYEHLFKNMVRAKAKQYGITPDEMLDRFIIERDILSAPFGVPPGMEGALAEIGYTFSGPRPPAENKNLEDDRRRFDEAQDLEWAVTDDGKWMLTTDDIY